MYDMGILNKWITEALYQIEKNTQQEKSKEKPTGILGGFFGWGAAPKKEEKKDDIKDKVNQIFELVTKELDQGKLEEIKGDRSLLFCGEFDILKCRIKLYQKPTPTSKQTIEAQFDGLSLVFCKRDNGVDVDAKIKSITVAGTSKPAGTTIKVITTGGTVSGKSEVPDENYLTFSFSFTEIGTTKKIKSKLVSVPYSFLCYSTQNYRNQ